MNNKIYPNAFLLTVDDNKVCDSEKWFFKNTINKKKNLLRAILYDSDTNVLKVVRKLRRICTVQEILVLEDILNKYNTSENIDDNKAPVQNLFPKNPIIENQLLTFKALELGETLRLISGYTHQNKNKIEYFLKNLSQLNKCILQGDFNQCVVFIKKIIEKCGYSSILIRKIVLINELQDYFDNENVEYIDEFLQYYNSDGNNSFLSSLQQCYQPEVDYFSLKKSIMRYTKFDCFISFLHRLPFKNRPTKSETLSSLHYSLSNSLIDALIHIKSNEEIYETEGLRGINWFIDTLDIQNLNINDVSGFYLDYFSDNKYRGEVESIFVKQLSAWSEVKGISPYRLLIDYFNDSPDSSYLNLNDESIHSTLDIFINNNDLKKLLPPAGVLNTNNKNPNLTILMNSGHVTRSAIFNYEIFLNHNNWILTTKELFSIMEATSDLPRTIDSKKIRIMSDNACDIESKIIYSMLLSKKTQNNEDGYLLRKFIQNLAISRFDSDLIQVLEYFHSMSPTVSLFTYEILTEDCLSLMPFIIDSAYMITETRAKLHDWRASKSTDDGYVYSNMAKTLRIEHQINEIRNEIDDHRVYVDITRFNEWLFNDIYINFNNTIMSLAQKNLLKFESPQILDFINIVYEEFCTNSVFGITSYLGRRIRHGTYKGHAFSSINEDLEESFPFLTDSSFLKTWEAWKSQYEEKVDRMITEKLHIKTLEKPEGLIEPTIFDKSSKEIIAKQCIETLIKDYETNEGNGFISIIDEYCWNLITINLSQIHVFMQNEKVELMSVAESQLLRKADAYIINNNIKTIKPFSLEFQRIVDIKYKKINDWFQRPPSVSPKVRLSLLFAVVVKQVKETFKEFKCEDKISIKNDIELFGMAFLCIYDALFVVIYNAAKHGDKSSELDCSISYNIASKIIDFSIVSKIKDSDNELTINKKLSVSNEEDIEKAQLVENNSGIKKLYNLDRYDKHFALDSIDCHNKEVHASFTYKVSANV